MESDISVIKSLLSVVLAFVIILGVLAERLLNEWKAIKKVAEEFGDGLTIITSESDTASQRHDSNDCKCPLCVTEREMYAKDKPKGEDINER